MSLGDGRIPVARFYADGRLCRISALAGGAIFGEVMQPDGETLASGHHYPAGTDPAVVERELRALAKSYAEMRRGTRY